MPMMWLLSALTLIVTSSVHARLDDLKLMQHADDSVMARVQLENDWQCLWWHWQHSMTSDLPVSACGLSVLAVILRPEVCTTSGSMHCEQWEVEMHHLRADGTCDGLWQQVGRHTLYRSEGQPIQRLWRGSRRWQSCAGTEAVRG